MNRLLGSFSCASSARPFEEVDMGGGSSAGRSQDSAPAFQFPAESPVIPPRVVPPLNSLMNVENSFDGTNSAVATVLPNRRYQQG